MREVEEWRPVPGCDGYEVSNVGRVRSWRMPGNATRRRNRPWIRKTGTGTKGHTMVLLMVDGKAVTKYVHRLMMAAFVGPLPEGMEVAHNNGIPDDNRLENLRYATRSSNRMDRLLHGTHNRGVDHPFHILTPEDVLAIRRALEAGQTRKALGLQYGVSKSNIQAISERRTWAWLEEVAA